ncbi:MAG: PIN domain nuclease [Bdellovibrio sp.]|nr:PIN domain nuclease [Bdellovibrio sp.]
MILVDSSVWIEYFSQKHSLIADLLERYLNDGKNIVAVSLVITEVLCGFKQDKDFEIAHDVLIKVPIIPISFQTHIRAAQLYRKLRRKGITISGPIDCLIAQVCIEFGATVFSLDQDFQKIEKETTLSIYNE